MLSTLFPPMEVQLGMMIFDVVEDQDNMAPSMTTDPSHLLDKGGGDLRVSHPRRLLGWHRHQEEKGSAPGAVFEKK